MYDRVRHLDLTTTLENLALVKRTLNEHEGSQLPDEWRVSKNKNKNVFHMTVACSQLQIELSIYF